MTPVPFTLEIPEADIEDLRTRLTRTRLPDQAPDAPWAYGTDLAYMRERTVGKLLHRMGLSRMQPRPHNPKRDLEAQEAFKKTSPRL